MANLTRRALFKAGAACMSFLSLPAFFVVGENPSRAGIAASAAKGKFLSHFITAGDREGELFIFDAEANGQEYARPATLAEYRQHLEAYPAEIDRVAPDKVREIFGEDDGELLALFSRLHRIRAAEAVDQDPDEIAYLLSLRADVYERIAGTEARTACGAYLQLELVGRERWYDIGLTKDQRDRLVFSARNVLFRVTRSEA